MNIKKIYLFFKNIPIAYVLASFVLFLLIVLTTIKTHHKVEGYYELAHFKAKEESSLSQLTLTELNEIRLLLISRIVGFSKVLKTFKLFKSNSTINVDNVPKGVLTIGKTIKKWPTLLESDSKSLKIELNDLNVNYLDRIILEDATVDKQSSKVNILMKLKKNQFKGRFTLCLKNGTVLIGSCLDGQFTQIADESMINWSAKLLLQEQLKFTLNDVNLKNHLIANKLHTHVQLNNEQTSNQFIDQVIFEFIEPYLNKEFNKLVNYEIGQTISSIYADLFEMKKEKNSTEQTVVQPTASSDKDFAFFKENNESSKTNQTTIQLIRNLIGLPSMISNVMYRFIEQNLGPIKSNGPKVTFHNQDIETILKTNLSTLQALKTKYLSTLKDSFESSADPTKPNLPTIAQPFLELIESQLRETIETKIDGLINTMMANFNNHVSKQKAATNDDHHSYDQSSGEHLVNEASEADLDSTVESVDHDEVLPENDEIMDEYTQSVRSQRRKRQVPCQRGQELDEYVDSLFRFASRLVRAMEPISLPKSTICLPEMNMQLFLYMGGATRAHTLQRKRPAWVYCTNESVSLGLTVGFEDLRVKYKYRAIKDWGLLWDGELEAKMEHAKIQVQFTQTTPEEDSEVPVMQRIDRIRIWRLGHVRVMLKGLGNFTQAVSMLLTRMLNQNLDQLQPTLRHLEGEVIGIGNNMLRNISIPFFSII